MSSAASAEYASLAASVQVLTQLCASVVQLHVQMLSSASCLGSTAAGADALHGLHSSLASLSGQVQSLAACSTPPGSISSSSCSRAFPYSPFVPPKGYDLPSSAPAPFPPSLRALAERAGLCPYGSPQLVLPSLPSAVPPHSVVYSGRGSQKGCVETREGEND